MLNTDGIAHKFVRVAGETRSCINILDEKYGSTEYLEPGCEISPEEEADFYEKLIDQVIVTKIQDAK